MMPASGVDLSTDPFTVIYQGPKRIQPNLPNVVDIVQVGDFESVLSWAIGLRSGQVDAPLQVFPGAQPRVVLTIAHAPAASVVSPSFTG